MLNSCGSFFHQVTTFVKKTKEIVTQLPNNNWDSHTIGKVYKLMERADLIRLIEEYNNSNQPEITKTKTGNQICARVFSVHKPPFFAEIYSAVNSANVALYTIAVDLNVATQQELQKTIDQGKNVTSTFKDSKKQQSSGIITIESSIKRPSRRVLQGLGPTQVDPFAADVVIFSSSDNMFTSYNGATGSTEQASVNAVPMNCSMVFP